MNSLALTLTTDWTGDRIFELNETNAIVAQN